MSQTYSKPSNRCSFHTKLTCLMNTAVCVCSLEAQTFTLCVLKRVLSVHISDLAHLLQMFKWPLWMKQRLLNTLHCLSVDMTYEQFPHPNLSPFKDALHKGQFYL